MTEQEIQAMLRRWGTPLYLFDLERLESRVRLLREILPEGTELCFAVKANPFLAREVSGLVERLELCSPGEYEICRQLQIPRRQFVISGVHKEAEWTRQLVRDQDGDMIYTVESLDQYKVLRAAAHAASRRISLLVRLTSGNQFGIEKEQAARLLAAEDPLLDVRGVQYFSGTQKTSLGKLRREIQELDEFIARCGMPVRELEFGPGFPVSCFQGDTLREEEFLRQAAEYLGEMRYRGRKILELGRSIAAGCGFYFTRVVDQKTNRGQNYAIVDGGMHQLVYYGQSLAMRRPRFTLFPPRREGGDSRPWTICGSLCTINDILVKQAPLEDLRTGDVLIFENAGAYCMTEGIALFLSRELPRILFRRTGGSLRCVRGEIQTRIFNTPYELEKETDDGTTSGDPQ